MEEIVFTYNDERCHAEIVESLPENCRLIGELNGYLLYQKKSTYFDQFGFVAVRKEQSGLN